MALMCVLTAAVNKNDWRAVKEGDDEAIVRVRKSLSKCELYFHALTGISAETHVLVHLADLVIYGIVKGITLNTGEEKAWHE